MLAPPPLVAATWSGGGVASPTRELGGVTVCGEVAVVMAMVVVAGCGGVDVVVVVDTTLGEYDEVGARWVVALNADTDDDVTVDETVGGVDEFTTTARADVATARAGGRPIAAGVE